VRNRKGEVVLRLKKQQIGEKQRGGGGLKVKKITNR
jgi:hypothetical protein